MSNPNKNAVDFANLIKDKSAMRKDIAPVETSATASQAYKAGEKFYYENLLQEATQDIAQGDTLTLNTNYKNAAPVTTSIQNLSTVVSKNGAKNFVALNRSPYRAQSTPNVSSISTQTEDELIFTTANGTYASIVLNYTLPIGTYKVSCDINSSDSYSPRVGVYLKNGNQDISNVKITDGETKEFTVTNEVTHVEIACLGTETTAAVRTVTFRDLMIRLASDTDPTYQPYAKTNVELTADSLAAIDNRNILGAKNFVALNRSPYKNQTLRQVSAITTQSEDTLIFTTNNATWSTVLLYYVLPVGNYIMSCEMSSSDSYSPSVGIYFKDSNGNDLRFGQKITNGATTEFSITSEVAYVEISFSGSETSGTAAVRTVTFRNLMIRLASDPDATYVPYAMGNRELTQFATAHELGRIQVSSDVTTYLGMFGAIFDAVEGKIAQYQSAFGICFWAGHDFYPFIVTYTGDAYRCIAYKANSVYTAAKVESTVTGVSYSGTALT